MTDLPSLLVVVGRYGDVPGGAEVHARNVVQRLAPHFAVEVATTTATDYRTWESELTAGIDVTHIPYKGSGPATIALMTGEVDFSFAGSIVSTPYIQAGTITGYAITSKKRVPTLPNVPTSAEAGVPGFDVTTWYGLYAPRNTPKPILDALVDALQKALKDPALVNRFAELSMAPVEQERATPAALEAHLRSEIDRWGRIIKDAGITPQ